MPWNSSLFEKFSLFLQGIWSLCTVNKLGPYASEYSVVNKISEPAKVVLKNKYFFIVCKTEHTRAFLDSASVAGVLYGQFLRSFLRQNLLVLLAKFS